MNNGLKDKLINDSEHWTHNRLSPDGLHIKDSKLADDVIQNSPYGHSIQHKDSRIKDKNSLDRKPNQILHSINKKRNKYDAFYKTGNFPYYQYF